MEQLIQGVEVLMRSSGQNFIALHHSKAKNKDGGWMLLPVCLWAQKVPPQTLKQATGARGALLSSTFSVILTCVNQILVKAEPPLLEQRSTGTLAGNREWVKVCLQLCWKLRFNDGINGVTDS